MKSDTHEEWRPIEEVKGVYSVSDKGRVKNNRTGIILKPVTVAKGYLKVNLKVDGKSYNRLVHRLVAKEFIENPSNKPEVNHKNGIHTDNRLSNLEWVTGEENRKHACETGLIRHKDNRYSGYLYSVWLKKHRNNMCEEWQDYLLFYEWCYKNEYRNGLRVSRYDTLKEYSPNNCYISTNMQHSKIPLSKRKWAFECFGKTMSIEELSELYDLSVQTITYRINKGMSIEDAVTIPLRNGRPRKNNANNN